MLTKAEKGRIDWVDVAKGISIFFVVYFHTIAAHNAIVTLFHVPTFLFISGYLFKPEKDFKPYFTKKFKQLAIPYFAFMLVMVFPLEFVFMGDADLTSIVKRLVRDLLAIEGIGIPATAFWFIPCLFFTQQIYNLLDVRFSKKTMHIFMSVSLLTAYLYSHFFHWLFLPGAFQTVLYTLPIFHLGVLFRQKFETLFATKRIIISIVIAAIAVLLLFEFNPYFNATKLDIPRNDLAIPFISFIASTLAILLVVYISKFIALKGGIVKTSISQLGTASLVIMITHQPIQYILAKYCKMGNVRLILALLIPLFLYHLFQKSSITRACFLGIFPKKKKDQNIS